MKALVTGGNGFLGRHVVAALRADCSGVRVLDPVRRDGPSEVEQLTADLLASDELESAFAGVDVLVHLAAWTRGAADEVIRKTVGGSLRLFEAMTRTQISRVVLASSLSVYDWSKVADALHEEDETLDSATARAYDGYAQAKTLQERLAREFAGRHGWTLTVLRPAVLWGRGVWEFLIGRRLGPLQMVVAPSAPIRLVYVENAADAFVRAAERSVGGERILNLIDPSEVTTWRYAGIVRRHRGCVRVPIPYALGLLAARLAARMLRSSTRLPYFLQPLRFEALHKPASCSALRTREAVGWHPRFNFEGALARARSSHA